jgi:SagB-type dehydrogenase family enzyme
VKPVLLRRVDKLDRIPRSVWSEYHAASRYYEGVANAITDENVLKALESRGVEYRFAQSLSLTPDTLAMDGAELAEIVRHRRSTRAFAGRPVAKAVLDGIVERAFILTDTPDGVGPRRPTPSAGRLYPIELYLVSLLGTDFPPGAVAHLAAHPKRSTKNWALLPLTATAAVLDEGLLHQLPAGTAGVFVLSATVSKATAKYGERGYRFCLIEIGHVAQNLLITLQAAGLESVCLGGFADSVLNRLLGLDGFNEAALYTVCFGYPLAQASTGDKL